jgi:hypothetical protein
MNLSNLNLEEIQILAAAAAVANQAQQVRADWVKHFKQMKHVSDESFD